MAIRQGIKIAEPDILAFHREVINSIGALWKNPQTGNHDAL